MRFLPTLRSFIFISVICCFSVSAQNKKSLLTKIYSPAELKTDAEILKTVIFKMHPVIGVYESAEHYEKLFNDFIASLTDSLTEKQFRIRVKLLLNELHCGHTEVLYSKAYYKELNKQHLNYSPYIFIPVKDKIYILANINRKRDSILPKGLEITKINEIKADSLLNYSRRFISGDGYIKSGKEHYVQYGFNSFLLGLFSRPDTFKVEFLKDGKAVNYRYKSFKLKNFPPLPIGPKPDSLLTHRKRAGIHYRFMNEENTVFYLKLDKFSHAGFRTAYRKVFRRCRKNESKNLILDLRNNGGGSLANSYEILTYLIDTSSTQTLRTKIKNYPLKKYTRGNLGFKFTRMVYGLIGQKIHEKDDDKYIYTLKPRKKNHYKGKIYVLINGGSFSASCLVSAYLSISPNVTFIGAETGGAIEGCNAGVTPYYSLPKTALRIRVPAFRVLNDVQPVQTGHGILPNYPIEYSLQDIFQKKDLEILKAKELIGIK